MSKYLLALAILISVGPLSPAFAEPFSTMVRTDDLDLTTLSGQARLERRVKYAAQSVCTHNGTRDLALLAKERECFNTAMRAAQVQVAALVEKAVRAKS